ncbi:MAG TPA: glycosyltransferase family 1 protein [Candidatus Dormibacteraeota bacterium]
MNRVALVDHAGTGSGVGSFLRGLMAGLLEEAPAAEWSFEVVLPERDYGGRPVEWPAELAAANLAVRREGDVSGQSDGRRWIERALAGGGFDLAYFAYPYLAGCPDLGVPIVATAHDFNHKRFGTWSADLRARVERDLAGWLRRSDVVVVSSRFIAAELAAYHAEAAPRCRVVRLGVPAAAEGRTADQGGPALPRGFLLSVGWIAPHKNQAVILRALGLLRAEGLRVPLVLAGPNAGEVEPASKVRTSYAWHLVRVAEALGLEAGRDYIPLGYVGRAELERLYGQAAALVMPTLYEAGSFPIREALRLGCPVIAADIPAHREDLGLLGHAGRLFDPYAPAELAAAIREVVEAPRATRSEAEAAGARLPAVFDWRRTARGYLAAFRAALAAPAA